jgi:hypothetical protein
VAVTAHVYTLAASSLANKLADLDSDALYCMLLTAYTPGQDTHQFLSDVLGAGTQVANGSGYTTNGVALTSLSLAVAGHVVTLNAADATWTSATISAAYAVFYDRTPATDATRPVLAYWDLGGTQSSTAGTFKLTLSSGVLTLTGS